MNINAQRLSFKALNDKIRNCSGDIVIDNCIGQRYIASGQGEKTITINGIPGNALGSYLDGADIYVNGNAQDAVGDTMNAGKIVIQGSAGDALGYAMRGGKIFTKGNSGYRTGIHMKEYGEQRPVIVVGGCAGSFLGEYMAGGLVIVLNLYNSKDIVGNFTGTGMYGGRIFLRADIMPNHLPNQVEISEATKNDIDIVKDILFEYSKSFSIDFNDIINHKYFLLKANAKNPYKQLYIKH